MSELWKLDVYIVKLNARWSECPINQEPLLSSQELREREIRRASHLVVVALVFFGRRFKMLDSDILFGRGFVLQPI